MNNQLNLAITQNVEIFQEPVGSANEDEGEVNHLQETQEVNAAQIVNYALRLKIRRTSLWTEEEDQRLIELKKQQPTLPWKEMAQHFPAYTEEQCCIRWSQVLEPRLIQEGKLIYQGKQINPTAASKNWTQEENERFIELKQQQPNLPWKEFAKYFPGHTDQQCKKNWNNKLKVKLIKKRKLTGEESSDDRLSKRLRMESSAITENVEIFQEPVGSANEDEGEVNHLQEIQEVNAAQTVNYALGPKMRILSLWTEEEDQRLIELKQQPKLPWKDMAQHFPGHTEEQCCIRWCQVLEPRLIQEGKLIYPKAEQINPTAASRKWTQEENERFIELKQQQPDLPWKEFAKHFPGHTDQQCKKNWNQKLKVKLIKKGE